MLKILSIFHFLLLFTETILIYFFSQMISLTNGISYNLTEIGFIIPVLLFCILSPLIIKYSNFHIIRPIIFALVKGFSSCYSSLELDFYVILILFISRFNILINFFNCALLFFIINDGYIGRRNSVLKLALNVTSYYNVQVFYFIILYLHCEYFKRYKSMKDEEIFFCYYSSVLCSIFLLRLTISLTPANFFKKLSNEYTFIFHIIFFSGIPIGSVLMKMYLENLIDYKKSF